MKTYLGKVTNMDWWVGVHDDSLLLDWQSGSTRTAHLNPRTDLRNHSPDGFAWGYNGSGPAQLALAILADRYEDDAFALEFYQRFKAAVIANYGMEESWVLHQDDVDAHMIPIVDAHAEKELRLLLQRFINGDQ